MFASETLSLGSLTWVEIALIIFFLVFVGVVIRVALARRGRYDAAARIPLDDQHVFTPRDGEDASPDSDGSDTK